MTNTNTLTLKVFLAHEFEFNTNTYTQKIPGNSKCIDSRANGRCKNYMLATCRTSIEIMVHGSYMRIIPPTCETATCPCKRYMSEFLEILSMYSPHRQISRPTFMISANQSGNRLPTLTLSENILGNFWLAMCLQYLKAQSYRRPVYRPVYEPKVVLGIV